MISPTGWSRGRLRQNVSPVCTSATARRTRSGVSRFSRPSWSSGPKSPHVEPSGRLTQRSDKGRLQPEALEDETARRAAAAGRGGVAARRAEEAAGALRPDRVPEPRHAPGQLDEARLVAEAERAERLVAGAADL